jgi:hypothetical protein
MCSLPTASEARRYKMQRVALHSATELAFRFSAGSLTTAEKRNAGETPLSLRAPLKIDF